MASKRKKIFFMAIVFACHNATAFKVFDCSRAPIVEEIDLRGPGNCTGVSAVWL